MERVPVAWQEIHGQRVAIDVGYALAADGSIGFALGVYDPTYPLTIDPALVYSTYLGGNGGDLGNGIAVDSAGNYYLIGTTSSVNFPTANPLQGELSAYSDAFVTKLNAAGDILLYSTYLGGREYDGATAIAVDEAGNVALTGLTGGFFPIVNAVQPGFGGGDYDAFVARLNATGTTLLYSTYLGGTVDEGGVDVAVDRTGNTYLTGKTTSSDFPTAQPLQEALH
ncbi:MAG: SBBP repeat-containing protein, partial [Ardenticatenaceae bacterium]